MNTLEVSKIKTDRIARTFRPIAASAKSGTDLPTRIELLKVGIWDTVSHGMFAVTEDDLREYKTNYDNGVAQAGGTGIMIDYDHESRYGGKSIAAGWIRGLDVAPDANGVMTLFADPVDWTGQGEKDLIEGNYKCISPEFFPASRGGWEDPEQYGVFIPNVLAAAGLVNRPLFKGLDPIMASANSGQSLEDKEVIYISASERNKMPTLEEVRVKDQSALTEEEKTFLEAHKDELSGDEKQKFGFEAAQTATETKTENTEGAQPVAETTTEEATVPQELAAIAASIKSGDSVVIASSEHKMLTETAAEYRKEKAEGIVAGHIERGAIKPDAKDKWVGRLVAASGTARTELEEMLTDIPDNGVVASARKGANGENAGDATKSATELIREKAQAAVAASAVEGKPATLSMPDAISQVRRENPELVKQEIAEA